MQIIWNSSTRSELLKFVDQQRSSQGPDGSYRMEESQGFTYQALSKELHVGNVYLRVYNNQPDFEISEPEIFCIALLEFISGLVNSLSSQDLDVQNRPFQNGSFVDQSEVKNDSEGTGKIDDSSSVSCSEETSKHDSELIKNLQTGLTSLQVHNLYAEFHLLV